MKPAALPLVSIIVPSYNQGRFIGETLQSILAQDYRPLEVLVVDGASTDDTVAVLERLSRDHPELRYWSAPDDGVADAVNKGLARASGVFAGIQSSDDLYRPGAISAAVAALLDDDGLDLVCADAEIINEDGSNPRPAPGGTALSLEAFLCRATIIHQSSTFFRLARARAAGGYDARYFCADSALWLRMLSKGRGRKLAAVWSAWRRHAAQRDREATRMWEAWGSMIENNTELRDAPLRLRLAAQAGRRLMALDYSPTRSRIRRLARIWTAVLIYPSALRAIPRKSVLVPGLGRVLGRRPGQPR